MSEFRTESDVDVPAFIREAFAGYVTALLWTATWEGGDAPEGRSNSEIELGEFDRSVLLPDLVSFVVANWYDCELYVERIAKDFRYSPWEQLGHDFALTRNHHGTGFWDRGLGDLGDRLTKVSQVYGEASVFAYVEDTDQVGVEVTS